MRKKPYLCGMKRFWILCALLWVQTTITARADVASSLGDTLSLDEVTVTAIKQSVDLRSQATALTIINSEEADRNQVV